MDVGFAQRGRGRPACRARRPAWRAAWWGRCRSSRRDRARRATSLWIWRGDLLRRAEEATAAGDIEEGFVDRDRLDQVGEAPEDLEQLLLHGEVGLHVDRQKDGLRAETLGLGHGHGRAHTAGARFVGGGAHHAATLGAAADDDGPAAQLGVARLFHRGEEGVHVDEQDGADHRLPSCAAASALSSPLAFGSDAQTMSYRLCEGFRQCRFRETSARRPHLAS